MPLIYKITPAQEWQAARKTGIFKGSAIDLKDGFIHFSTASQTPETAGKHFAGQSDLMLISIDETKLGDRLKYEVSRGGAEFPHLYGDLSMDAVVKETTLESDANGNPIIPPLEDHLT